MASKVRYWATFRLKKDATYNDRYNALVKAFEDAGSLFWAEPTSFVAFDSEHSIDAIAAHLKRALNPQVDILLLYITETASARYVGTPENTQAFFHHFPMAKKV